jgi:hypothetical protein
VSYVYAAGILLISAIASAKKAFAAAPLDLCDVK